jgi:glycosyltransferase involved in cell wall biosynthesis
VSKVSVVIATYSRAAMVREAVEAALSQTRPPEEIIVADDASTDQTLAVLEQLAQSHRSLCIVRQTRNTGGVPNWNAAFNGTTGEFLAWCSDDDRFLPDHLEASLAYLEAHPDVGMVHSGFVDAVETGDLTHRIARPHRFAEPYRVDRDNLISYMIRCYDWPFHPSTIVVRREVWAETGPFDPSYALADTEWFVRVAERFSVVLLPRHGVVNRRHPGNWSNRVGSATMQHEIFAIVEAAIERLWSENLIARVWARAIWRANVRLRLLLTVRIRIRGGHRAAATALWHQMLQGTGLSAPAWLERMGTNMICRLCAGREASFEDARQSVSPL